MIALAIFIPADHVRAADTLPTTGVLIVHSNQRLTPAAIVIENILRAYVSEHLKAPVEIFSEYLDEEWPLAKSYGDIEADFFRNKYARRNIAVIVAAAPQALRFALQYRDRIVDGAPIVHVAMPADVVERMSLPAHVFGKTQDLDPIGTLQLVLRLHPRAIRLVVVLGSSERDRGWERRVRSAVERLERRIEVEYLSGLPTAEVLGRLAALGPGTVVFTPGYIRDGAGEVVTPRQSAERMAQASAVPVYSPIDTHMGAGIVGGHMTPYDEQARQAGALVVAALQHELSAHPRGSVPKRYIVDWRQLQRWQIDERLLPADTIVRYREPTAWEKYQREISVGVALLLLQTALITLLVLERRSRRRTAAALAESRRHMDLAVNAARLSVWAWDTQHNPERKGAAALRDAKSKDRCIAFARVMESVHPADRDRLEQAVARTLDSNEELDIEYRTMSSDGEVRWIAARGRAESVDSVRLFGVALDITERRAADLRASEDRRALQHMTRVSIAGQLSAAIAHQLNQPLAAILGNAEAARKMLDRKNVDLQELCAICDDIMTEDQRAAEVIRRLSALYKRGDIKVEPIDVHRLVRETLELARTELVTRGVVPITQLTATMVVVGGGNVQLQQVVLNLVLNAADAMAALRPENRRLIVRTESCPTHLELSVIDNGVGIAEGQLKSVFDPFWSTKPEGMGMGLAVCQSIVTAHHGAITAANNPEGGAKFCVSLPLWRESA